jgi:hypothetical protein
MRKAWTTGNMDEYNKAVADKLRTEVPAQTQAIDPEVAQWGQQNAWFTQGYDELGVPNHRAIADMEAIVGRYRQMRPNEPAINAVRYAEGKVRANYPDFFKPAAPARAAAPAVEAGTRGAAKPPSKGEASFGKMSGEEQKLVRQMAKASGMSIDEYMSEYARGKV